MIELLRNGEKISGESLREELQLPSSNFTWEEKNGNYIFTTKGIGHGFGYDQYYGNLLAEQGQDYQEILHYFIRISHLTVWNDSMKSEDPFTHRTLHSLR